MKLTDAYIKGLKPPFKKPNHPDGGGLSLHIAVETGTKVWRYRYRYLGKPQTLTIGQYPNVSLKEARAKHAEAKALLASGNNPMGERKKDKLLKSLAVANSFHSLAEKWFDHWSHGKDKKSVSAARGRLNNYIIPQLGSHPISELKAQDFVAMATKIEASGKKRDKGANLIPLTETAERCYQICGQVLDYANAHGVVDENPARSIKPSKFLKTKKPKNHARVEESELPALLKAIDGYGSKPTRLATQLMALVFVRTSELIKAKWGEIDFDNKVWRIPAERMKQKDPHIIPMSDQVADILKEMEKISGNREYIFPSTLRPNDDHMSNATILRALDRLGYKNKMTGHGFRGIASTILHEMGYNHIHIETQLAHLTGNKVSRSYDASKYLPERTRMMQDWANYLDAIKEGGKVIGFKKAAA